MIVVDIRCETNFKIPQSIYRVFNCNRKFYMDFRKISYFLICYNYKSDKSNKIMFSKGG